MNNHETFMAMALKQAKRGLGRTRPNPMVGCVVVKDGEVQIRTILELKHSFDERVEDGLKCAIGLQTLMELMEDPTKWDSGISDLEGKPPAAV